ncbi:MAG: hypothetical protein CMP35_00190 [Rickettsiales bacterium]|nr:hypothetical protein [Rickettsiales bacterium]|tara:strand:+ start:131 stop:3064 length:2934 start_codon:yes stop_codon:yes gene_type:complete
MRNLSFSGYAQRKGFDPNQVPDETWKLQDETERSLRGMREVRDQNRQNRNEVLQTLKDNSRKEAQQREINFNLQQEFREAYHDAHMQHFKTNILDKDVKIQEAKLQYERFEKLKDLAPKAIQAFAKFNQDRFQKILEKKSSLNIDLSEMLDTETYSRFKDLTMQGFTVGEILKQKMPELKEQIRKEFSAYELRAVQKDVVDSHLFNTMRKDWSQFSETHKINGLSFNEIIKDPNADEATLTAYLDEWRKQYENSFAFDERGKRRFGSDFIANEVRGEIDKFSGDQRKIIKTNVEQSRGAEAFKNEGKSYRLLWKEKPTQIFNTANLAPDRAGIINTAFTHLESGFKENLNGQYTETYLQQLKAQKILVDGKEVTLGEKFWKRFDPIQKVLDKRLVADDRANTEKAKLDMRRYAGIIQQQEEKGYAKSPALYKKIMEDLAQQDHITMYDFERLPEGKIFIDGANRSEEDYSVEKWDGFAKLTLEQKGRFTMNELSSQAMPYSIKKRLFFKTAEGRGLDGAEFDKEVTKLLTQSMKSLSGLKSNDQIGTTQIDGMLPHAKKHFYNYFFDYMDKNVALDANGNPKGDTSGLGSLALQDYIKSMDETKGFYQVDGVGVQATFRKLDDLHEAAANIRVRDQLSSDLALISDKDFLTEKMDQEIINAVNNGGALPEIVYKLYEASNGVLDPIEIVNGRLRANGIKEIEYKGAQILHKHVHPDFKKAMNNFPTKAKTFNALKNTAAKEGNEFEVMDSIVESMMMDKEIASKNNPDKAVRTPTGIKEINLEATTVDGVFNLMQSGQVFSISGFNITKEDLRREISKGNLTGNTFLTKANLRDIAKQKMFDESAKMYAPNIDDGIPGVGQSFTLPFNYTTKLKKKLKRGTGVGQQNRSKDFDKTVMKLANFAADTQIAADTAIPLAGKFLVDRIRDVITADNTNLGRKQRFEKAKETVVSASAASKGLMWDDMTPESQNFFMMGFE